MRPPRLAPLLALAALAACARPVSTATPAPAAAPATVVVLVRHAEKAAEPGPDPSISEAGVARARALAALPEVQGARAVAATQYRRTQQTAAPLAERRHLAVRVDTVGADVAAYAARVAAWVRARPAGDTVVVVGHSNTVPAVIAALGAAAPTIADAEYGRVFVVTLGAGGAALREGAYPAGPR